MNKLARLIHFYVTSSGSRIGLSGRWHRLSIAALLSFAYLPALATPEKAWQAANSFYQQKQYDSAAFYFEQIASQKPSDPKVFYNLGNTYYRLNKIAPAVLNYERALKRAPGYKQAAENLLLTQSRIPGFTPPPKEIFFIRWWNALTAPGLIAVWSVLSLLLFISLIGLLLYRRLYKGKVYIRPQIPATIALLWLMSLLLAFSAAYAMMKDVRGVVMVNNASISRNDDKGKYAGTLPEGTTVSILALQGKMYEVTLPDGRSGYVDKSDITLVD